MLLRCSCFPQDRIDRSYPASSLAATSTPLDSAFCGPIRRATNQKQPLSSSTIPRIKIKCSRPAYKSISLCRSIEIGLLRRLPADSRLVGCGRLIDFAASARRPAEGVEVRTAHRRECSEAGAARLVAASCGGGRGRHTTQEGNGLIITRSSSSRHPISGHASRSIRGRGSNPPSDLPLFHNKPRVPIHVGSCNGGRDTCGAEAPQNTPAVPGTRRGGRPRFWLAGCQWLPTAGRPPPPPSLCVAAASWLLSWSLGSGWLGCKEAAQASHCGGRKSIDGGG